MGCEAPYSWNLTCSFCGKKFPPINNGDDVSPCCNAGSVEGMSQSEYEEWLEILNEEAHEHDIRDNCD